jgi:hypothetical protein
MGLALERFSTIGLGVLGFLCGHKDWAGGGYRTRRNTVLRYRDIELPGAWVWPERGRPE